MIVQLNNRLQEIDTQLGNIARLRALNIVEDKEVNDSLFILAITLNKEHSKLVKTRIVLENTIKYN